MKTCSITKIGKNGTPYRWIFAVNYDTGYLKLEDVKVHGESILEVVDPELQQKVYEEARSLWINIEA